MPEQPTLDGEIHLAAERLSSAFASSLRSIGKAPELRSAICAFVDAAKAAGQPVERVVIDLKRIARDSELRPATYSRRSSTPSISRDDLIAQAVTSCIKHYFSSDVSEPQPPRPATDNPDWTEVARASSPGRLDRSVEMLIAYQRMLSRQAAMHAAFNDAMQQSQVLRVERTLMAAIRASDKIEREELRTAVYARVHELRKTAFSSDDVITAIRNIMADAVQRGGLPNSSDFLQEEAVAWAREAMNVA